MPTGHPSENPSRRGDSAAPAGSPGEAVVVRRLIASMIELVSREGYSGLSVERLITHAQVSRASFYQYYGSIQDCFSDAWDRAAAEVDERISRQLAGAGAGAVAAALAGVAAADPSLARMVLAETLSAGCEGRRRRRELIARLAARVSDERIELPVGVLLGAVMRYLTICLEGAEPLQGASDAIEQWANRMTRAPTDPQWAARLAPPRLAIAPANGAPHRMAVGPGPTRERIMRATAASVREHGYRATSVAVIATIAGVSRRTFYNEFDDKSDAFIQTYEHAFQIAVAASTVAYFQGSVWPERVWLGLDALTRLFASEPVLGHLGLVEIYAVGRPYFERIHETQLAFTIFLEDGYRQRPGNAELGRGCAMLSGAAIFELAFLAAGENPGLQQRAIHPLATFTALAPFIGLQEAGSFVFDRMARRG